MNDMHTCDLCGKPTPNFVPWTCGPIAGKLGRSWCDDCEEQFKGELASEDEQLRYDDIDRPTCENVSCFGSHTVTQGDYFKGEIFDFVCDRCGVRLMGDEMGSSPLLECKLGHHAPLHYCPNCGSEVVEWTR